MTTPDKLAIIKSIQEAQQDGLAQQAADVMVANLDETILLGCVGADLSQLDSTEATLVSVVLDMSGSMTPYRQTVIESFNTMLGALNGSKTAQSILLSVWAFHDFPVLLRGYQPVAWHQPLTIQEYAPDNGTALYDALLGCMTGLVSYGQELVNNGVPNRRVLFVLTDGEDNVSRTKALDVRTAAEALVKQELYTLAYAGFGSTSLSKQAQLVGFPHVVTTQASESELRKIFRQVSASVIRVSQSTASPTSFF